MPRRNCNAGPRDGDDADFRRPSTNWVTHAVTLAWTANEAGAVDPPTSLFALVGEGVYGQRKA